MKVSKSAQFAIALFAALPFSNAAALEPASLMTPSAPPAIQERHASSGNLSVNQTPMRAPNRVMVSVSPNNNDDGVYRHISASAAGTLMISNFFGDGPNSTATGARKYYLFPRREIPSFEIYTTGEAAIRTASGQIVRIDPETGRINGISGAEFTEDPRINRSNNGGVEITRSNGLMLDCGWRLGGDPCARLGSTSTFRDAAGQTCRVSNRDLFVLEPSMALKYATDAELAGFLRERCPNLDLSSLAPAPTIPAVPQQAEPAEEETPSAGSALPDAPVETQQP